MRMAFACLGLFVNVIREGAAILILRMGTRYRYGSEQKYGMEKEWARIRAMQIENFIAMFRVRNNRSGMNAAAGMNELVGVRKEVDLVKNESAER